MWWREMDKYVLGLVVCKKSFAYIHLSLLLHFFLVISFFFLFFLALVFLPSSPTLCKHVEYVVWAKKKRVWVRIHAHTYTCSLLLFLTPLLFSRDKEWSNRMMNSIMYEICRLQTCWICCNVVWAKKKHVWSRIHAHTYTCNLLPFLIAITLLKGQRMKHQNGE